MIVRLLLILHLYCSSTDRFNFSCTKRRNEIPIHGSLRVHRVFRVARLHGSNFFQRNRNEDTMCRIKECILSSNSLHMLGLIVERILGIFSGSIPGDPRHVSFGVVAIAFAVFYRRLNIDWKRRRKKTEHVRMLRWVQFYSTNKQRITFYRWNTHGDSGVSYSESRYG